MDHEKLIISFDNWRVSPIELRARVFVTRIDGWNSSISSAKEEEKSEKVENDYFQINRV